MIQHHISNAGQESFTGTREDLQRVSEWGRSFLHLVYGPIEGEQVFRSTPAKNLLEVWARLPRPTPPSSTTPQPQ